MSNRRGESPDLITAAKSGDRLKTLIALRDLLAERLQETESSRDISSMSRRLMQCVSEIESLEQVKRDEEENPRKISELRKKLHGEYKQTKLQYEVGSIAREHEDF